jgi:hypothetical protein
MRQGRPSWWFFCSAPPPPGRATNGFWTGLIHLGSGLAGVCEGVRPLAKHGLRCLFRLPLRGSHPKSPQAEFASMRAGSPHRAE